MIPPVAMIAEGSPAAAPVLPESPNSDPVALAAEALRNPPPVKPHYWRCADPPWGCGLVKPIDQYQFKHHYKDKVGGGKDLCNDCRKAAYSKWRAQQVEKRIGDAVQKLGSRGLVTHTPDILDVWQEVVDANKGVKNLVGEVYERIRFMESNNKHLAVALGARMSLLRIAVDASRHRVAMKPVQDQTDDELLARQEGLAQMIVNVVTVNVMGQLEPPPDVIDEISDELLHTV